jgi:sugar O-acyltransferase (sialic acid O-acetyltransferase NeuD family)
MDKIILIGGGGHCHSCIDVIEQQGKYQIAGIVDMPGKLHQKVLGYEVIATDNDLPRLVNEYENFLITLGQIKSPEKRIRIFQTLKKSGAKLPVIISPLAYVSKHAEIGDGTIIMHNALINAGAKIGKNCIINTRALIEHDVVIADHCHIATGTIINGDSRIQTGTFFGSNSMTREYVEIGSNCIIGGDERVEELISTQCIQRPIKLGVFGASGFSRETADIFLGKIIDELVYIDLNPHENTYFGFPIVSEDQIPQLVKEGYYFAIGLGDNTLRKKIFEKYNHLSFPNILHSAASMGFKQAKGLREKRGNIITAGVRFTNNIQLGDFGIFNLNCTIGHDCIIENFVNIAPGANISGNVLIEEGAYIGTNATILQGKSIEQKMIVGKYATVGAGAVVINRVPDFTTVVNMPAKAIYRKKDGLQT